MCDQPYVYFPGTISYVEVFLNDTRIKGFGPPVLILPVYKKNNIKNIKEML